MLTVMPMHCKVGGLLMTDGPVPAGATPREGCEGPQVLGVRRHSTVRDIGRISVNNSIDRGISMEGVIARASKTTRAIVCNRRGDAAVPRGGPAADRRRPYTLRAP